VTLFTAGCCEPFKGGYHAALGLLLAGAVAYNLVALAQRRERQLAINVLLYSALVAWEARVCQDHRRDCP
jgi:hypothetical protein